MQTDPKNTPGAGAIRPPAIVNESLRLRAAEAAYLRELRGA